MNGYTKKYLNKNNKYTFIKVFKIKELIVVICSFRNVQNRNREYFIINILCI